MKTQTNTRFDQSLKCSILSQEMYLALQATYKLDYNDYMCIISDENELSDLPPEMSFNWGSTHLEQFLVMKKDFVKWYLWCINDSQRLKFFNYLLNNKDKLLSQLLN